MIIDKIQAGRIIPVIALDNAEHAVPLCAALKAGGLEVAEITFRTAAAREAIRLVAREFPDFALGAGTVTTLQEVEAAKEAGAQFAVAPGCNPMIITHARQLGLPFFPGVCTPSNIETALSLDCQLLKFFPAEQAGGIAMLKALHAPYKHRGVQFIPTGGITSANLTSYLQTPGVVAIGGSWMVAPALLKDQQWEQVTALTREAVTAAQAAAAAG